MSACLFCGIAEKRIPARTVYEDAHALAFLDIHPKAPGHLVVIPKVHAETLAALPLPEVGPLFAAVQKIAARARTALRADGLTIGINEGAAGGQAVGHLHVHILPRFADDSGGSVHTVVENPPKESLDTIAHKLQWPSK